MRIRESIAVLLALGMALPPSLMAQTVSRPNVAVGQIDVPEQVLTLSGQTKIALEESFEKNPRVYLVSPNTVDEFRRSRFPEKGDQDFDQILKDARAALGEGKKAYQSLDFESAKKHLKEAVRYFIAGLPGLRTNREFLDAHLYMGAAESVLENEAGSEVWFQRAVYLDPEFEPTARDFPPKILQLFSRVKRDIMTRDLARVKFVSSPPGASVFLNGKPLGETPLERRLPEGKYFVLMEEKGLGSAFGPETFDGRLVSVRKDLLPSDKDLQWAEFFRVREKPSDQRAAIDFLDTFGRETGADIIFLGSVYKQQEYRFLGQLYDVRTKRFSLVAVLNLGREPETLPDGAPGMVDTLTGFLDSNGFVASKGGKPAPSFPVADEGSRPQEPIQLTEKKKDPWYEKWWVYPLIGIAIGGSVIGVMQLNSGSDSSKLLIDNSGNF